MSRLSRYAVVIFMVVLLVTPVWVGAQSCDKSIKDQGATNFIVEAGLVKDVRTGLTWMRCAMGQRWQSETCTLSNERYNLSEAQLAIEQFNSEGGAFGFSDWRLPTVEELLTLVDSRCEEPALNMGIFPQAPITAFWSSTADADYPDGAMLVHFVNGHRYMGNRSVAWAVRLVRDP